MAESGYSGPRALGGGPLLGTKVMRLIYADESGVSPRDPLAVVCAVTEVLPPVRGEADIIREEITLAMVMAGIRALGEWEEKRDCGQGVTKSDLVSAIYASMRRT